MTSVAPAMHRELAPAGETTRVVISSGAPSHPIGIVVSIELRASGPSAVGVDHEAAGGDRVDSLFGLELTDAGFDASVLCEFRTRLLAGDAGERLPEIHRK